MTNEKINNEWKPYQSRQKKKGKIYKVQLRLDAETLFRIDRLSRNEPWQSSRHSWLLMAIHEKISSEESKLQEGPGS